MSIVEVCRYIIGPARSTVSTFLCIERADSRDDLLKSGKRKDEANWLASPNRLPKLAKTFTLAGATITWAIGKTQPMNLRSGISWIMVVVQIRRRGNHEIHGQSMAKSFASGENTCINNTTLWIMAHAFH